MCFYNNDEKTDMLIIYGECGKNSVAAADRLIFECVDDQLSPQCICLIVEFRNTGYLPI
jgi:hypothetical protein